MNAEPTTAPALEPVHFTRLKYMAKSPAHYHHRSTTPTTETRPMRVGSAVHLAVLLGQAPAIFDGSIRRGKVWDEFRAAHAGELILSRGEWESAQAVADAVVRSKIAMELLDGCEFEVPFEWDYLGRACSSRLDAVRPLGIVDLKVTSDASPEKFARHAISMGYHAQLAFYNMAAGRRADTPAYIIAAESSPPHPVTVFKLTENCLLAGERLCRSWMERLLVCESAGKWPEYAQCMMTLDAPDGAGLLFEIDGEEVEA